MRILILGAGGQGQVIADSVAMQAAQGVDVTVLGFLDDNPALTGKVIDGVEVLGPTSELTHIGHDAIVVGIGDNRTRAKLYCKLRASGEHIQTVIHPRATVARYVKIGRGTVVMAGAVINTGSEIGGDAIINTGSTVDHHARVSDHVHIAPGVHLGGGVTVGEGAFLGIGACVISNLRIGEWAVVGSGTVVIREVSPNAKVVGVPAKAIGSHRL
jgi:sugar O-acyltransferase (sialic acid O-acetyltransferase NeuD family)